MVGASKILTVSYGTFSCTLEGFDEPFNTMKAIAEYFRDLAADDRYFGAEPPTPDAAMLHRIAEREIQRRVEAKIQENGVILRAGDDLAQTAPKRAEPARLAPEPVAPQPAPAAQKAAPVAAPANLVDESAPEPESVAAKLLRIRAAVANAETVAMPEFSEDQHADATLADAAPMALQEEPAEEPTVLEEPRIAPPAHDIPVADLAADILPETSAPVTEDEAALPEDIAIPDADEAEAAMLAGLSADVDAPGEDADAVAENGAADSDVALSMDAFEEEEMPAHAWAEADEATVAADATDEAEADEGETAIAAPAEEAAEVEDTEDAADNLSRLMAAIDQAEVSTQPEADTADVEDVIEDAWHAGAEDLADEAEAALDQDDTARRDGITDAEDDVEPVAATDDADHDEAAAEAEDHARPAAQAEPVRARARVIKVRRLGQPAPASEPEDTAADAEPEDFALFADDADAEHDADAPRVLSPEDEDDLQRELAEVEREIEATRRAPGEGRKVLESEASEDAAVDRLMEETTSQMEGAEARRRTTTIAHLKAAVAATVADKLSLGSRDGKADEDMDRYREDLARVVRPRRPVMDGSPRAAAERPANPADRPAPLVLVSEQRIDRPGSEAEIRPVRPRRISTGMLALKANEPAQTEAEDEDDDSAIFSDTSSFNEFADRIGAHELPDLLEAAAAYAACVEGRPHFSRPQLMRQIAALSDDDSYSREDSLRSFGMLLRQGRIEKVKRGQFAISENSRFIEEARRVAR